MKYFLTFLFSFFSLCTYAQESIPCIGTTTVNLNVRSGPGTEYRKITTLPEDKQVLVLERAEDCWLLVEYDQCFGYVHSQYLKFSPLPPSMIKDNSKSLLRPANWIKVIFWIIASYLGAVIFFNIISWIAFVYLRIIKTASMIFYILNWLQRFIQKPWYVLLKLNRYSDKTNKTLRIVTGILKIPLYIFCTPLRFINAVFYNIFIHCIFEIYNYAGEVLHPASSKERGNSPLAPHMFIWRIIKYPIWHGTLSIAESFIWVILDTVFPALTMYHGTSDEVVANIVSSPDRQDGYYSDVGIWRVGGGNYAGNGIYFALILNTALHYSSGAVIVCRVSLGRIIDLGIAPGYVYRQCGHADALSATKWGLEHRYTTGEWWRPDEGWWEFCMYDWQNRYNYSWRIRPLYVLDSSERNIVRICGGMQHWLFNKMVISDMFASVFKS